MICYLGRMFVKPRSSDLNQNPLNGRDFDCEGVSSQYESLMEHTGPIVECHD